jgi:hypothetical protein
MHRVHRESMFSYSHYTDQKVYDTINLLSAPRLGIEDTDVFLCSRIDWCHPRQVSAFDGLCLSITTGRRLNLRLLACDL